MALPQTNRVPRNQELITTEDLYQMLVEIKALAERPPQPPTPPKTVHPLFHADFWLIFCSAVAVFMVFTSYIPTDVFEPLLTLALACQVLGMVFNLTRDRQHMVVRPITLTWVNPTGWLFGRKHKTLREVQHDALHRP